MKGAVLWVAAGLFVATAAFGLADSPDTDPPIGLDFADGTAGQQYQGYVTMIFSGFDGAAAPGFEAVTRLRKGNEVHVFYTPYDCNTADPCGICDPDIDVLNAVNIQLCLQDSIEAEVIADFALGDVDVRLKDVNNFVPEEDPADNTILVVAADVEVTTK
jgi:hypothetical protein